MNISEYLMEFRDGDGVGWFDEKPTNFPISDRIECKDGFSISVQAHQGAYCTPRQNLGPWTAVECGFPSAHPGDEMMPYIDGDISQDPADTVYGYVPVEVVARLIESHGGMREEE